MVEYGYFNMKDVCYDEIKYAKIAKEKYNITL